MKTHRSEEEQLGPSQFERRTTLAMAMAGALVWCFSKSPFSDARRMSTAEAALLVGLDPGPLVAVGRALLDAVPGLPSRSRLVSEALADIGLDARSVATVAPAKIAERRAAAIRNDFDGERTIKVDGWCLALSEVRLAVLAARCHA
jgi:hypothetical protein